MNKLPALRDTVPPTIPTADIADVPIFSAGGPFGPRQLDDILENFKRLSAGPRALVEVPVVIAADPAALETTALPSFGKVSRLRRSGDTLLADLTRVPLKV